VEPLGVGSSARPEHAIFLTARRPDCAALDRLGVRNAVVIAISLGARWAFRLAYRRPDLVPGSFRLDGGRPSALPPRVFGVP